MLRKFTLLCAAAALAGTVAFAQNMRPRDSAAAPDQTAMITMRVNMLAAQLNLTDAQKAQAITIFANANTASQTIRTSQQTNQQSLAAAVKTNAIGTIDSLSFTIGGLQGQLTAIDSKAEAAFYAILTTDQKTLYDAMPHGGPGGRGGPGGPGGGGRGMMGNGMRGGPPR
jgi:Spy/CpxP family protein refolding chaperone